MNRQSHVTGAARASRLVLEPVIHRAEDRPARSVARRVRRAAFAAAVLLARLPIAARGQEGADLFRIINDYPSEGNPGWHENAQGVTHGTNYWYFTQTLKLWKVRASSDLDEDADDYASTREKDLRKVPGLWGQGYDHFGDLGYHQGYLVIAVTGGEAGVPGVVAIFKASDLSYIGKAVLPGQEEGASGCAVGADGFVYTFSGPPTFLHKYALNWSALPDTIDFSRVGDRIALRKADGSPLDLHYNQGITFSPDGRYLYLVNGMMTGDSLVSCGGSDSFTEEEMRAHAGIHVIDLQTHRRVRKSTNGSGLFNYEFHPGYPNCEEPEGLTFWDLDGVPGRHYGAQGQLHVILLDNDGPGDSDDVYFKHYTSRIYVNCRAVLPPNGHATRPYKTVEQGINGAWSGAEIYIQACVYPESFVADKHVILTATGGSAIIGG